METTGKIIVVVVVVVVAVAAATAVDLGFAVAAFADDVGLL